MASYLDTLSMTVGLVDGHSNTVSPDDVNVTMLRMTIEHCIALTDEAGLDEAGEKLRQALQALGGPLLHVADRAD